MKYKFGRGMRIVTDLCLPMEQKLLEDPYGYNVRYT